MADDLVKRLRYMASHGVLKAVEDEKYVSFYEAADRIEQLEAALQKIAGEPPKDTWDEGLYWWAVEIAEATLAGEKKDD